MITNTQPQVVPVHRYYHDSSHDHFYTTNANEIGTITNGQVGNNGYKSEGVAFYALTHSAHETVPLYRYWNGSNKDHFYTADVNEIGATQNGQTGNHGYTCEGVVAYVSAKPFAGMVPLYRYWHATNSDHFYSTNVQEINATTKGQVGNYGYSCEGVAGYVYNHPYVTAPLYRYYHEGNKDHFYTANASEINATVNGQVGNHGYKCEGSIGHVFTSQVTGSVPLYRYWNSGSSDHFYTANPNEIGATQNGQTGNFGYTCEGIVGYVFVDQEPLARPLHRYWHEGNKDHFYTDNGNEIGTIVNGQSGNFGYKCEGVCGWLPL